MPDQNDESYELYSTMAELIEKEVNDKTNQLANENDSLSREKDALVCELESTRRLLNEFLDMKQSTRVPIGSCTSISLADLSKKIDDIQENMNVFGMKFIAMGANFELLLQKVTFIENQLSKKTETESTAGNEDDLVLSKLAIIEERTRKTQELIYATGRRPPPTHIATEGRSFINPETIEDKIKNGSLIGKKIPLVDKGPVFESRVLKDGFDYVGPNEELIFSTKTVHKKRIKPEYYFYKPLTEAESTSWLSKIWNSLAGNTQVAIFNPIDVADFNCNFVRWIVLFGGVIFDISHLIDENFPLYLKLSEDSKPQCFTEKEIKMMTKNFVGEIGESARDKTPSVQDALSRYEKKIEELKKVIEERSSPSDT